MTNVMKMLLMATITLTAINGAFAVELVTLANTSFIEEYQSYVLTYSEEMKFTIIIDLKSIYKAYAEIERQVGQYNALPNRPEEMVGSINQKFNKLKNQVQILTTLNRGITGKDDASDQNLPIREIERFEDAKPYQTWGAIAPAHSGHACLHTDAIILNLQTKFLRLNNIRDTPENRKKVIPALQSLGKVGKYVTKAGDPDLVRLCIITSTQTRRKRGLCNFCGKIQKFLYGVLTSEDIARIDSNIQNITDSVNIIKISVQKQSAVIRKLATEIGISIVDLNQAKVLLSYAVSLMSCIDVLLFDVSNVILAIETKAMLPQLVEPSIFLRMIDRLLNESKNNHVFNYFNNTRAQHFMDIADKMILLRKNNLIFELTIPKLENDKWDLYNIIPIPKVHNDTYIVTAPRFSHLLRQEKKYMVTNENEIRQMKKVDNYLITHYTHPIYNRINTPTCQNNIDQCKLSQIHVNNVSYISLYDNHGVLIIPEIGKSILFTVNCKNYTSEIYIKEVTLLKTTDKCTLVQDNTEIILNGLPEEYQLINPSETYLATNFSGLAIRVTEVANQIDTKYLKDIGQDLDSIGRDLERARIVLKHENFWNTMNGLFDGFIKIGLPSIGVIGVFFALWRFGALMPILKLIGKGLFKCCCPGANKKLEKYESKAQIELQKLRKQLDSMVEEKKGKSNLSEIRTKPKGVRPSASSFTIAEVHSNVGDVKPSV